MAAIAAFHWLICLCYWPDRLKTAPAFVALIFVNGHKFLKLQWGLDSDFDIE